MYCGHTPSNLWLLFTILISTWELLALKLLEIFLISSDHLENNKSLQRRSSYHLSDPYVFQITLNTLLRFNNSVGLLHRFSYYTSYISFESEEIRSWSWLHIWPHYVCPEDVPFICRRYVEILYISSLDRALILKCTQYWNKQLSDMLKLMLMRYEQISSVYSTSCLVNLKRNILKAT